VTRVQFYALWGVVFVVALHGIGVLWLALCLVTNYCALVALDKSYLSPIWTWIFGLGLLLSSKVTGVDYWRGFLEPVGMAWMVDGVRFVSLLGSNFEFMDTCYKGIYAWDKPLNLVFLRLISFNIEYWQSRKSQKSATESINHAAWFTFEHFVGYMLYPPLYVAGPIVGYDSFAAQVTAEPKHRAEQTRRGFKMLGWSMVYFLLLEVMLHYVYYHCVSRNLWVIFHGFPKELFFLPPWEVMLVGFYVLNYTYLKFLVIWRTSAAAALLDGVETPENLPRCVCNNYTFAGFWRAWHASFHAWTLRYVYLPLGGRATQHLSVLPIFLFVGLWHDLELRWAAWALSNAACLLAERAVLRRVAAPALAPLRARSWWRYAAAAVAAGNIYLLIVANLAIQYGFDGGAAFVRAIFRPPAAWVAPGEVVTAHAVAVWWLCCGVLLMFRVRESEACPGRPKKW
jgi:protein-cysteine N-palmitoyltransferase HHAT